MTQENEFEPQYSPTSVDAEYLALSQHNEAREVEMPKEVGEGPKTLSEAMDDATDLTDMQFTASRMFPTKVQVSDVMVGRVMPDAFLALLHIIVTDRIMSSDPGKPINVNEEIIKAYIMLTIGLDGKGRIDYAELLGAAKEIRAQESVLKAL